MLNRRHFIKAAATVLASPSISTLSHAQTARIRRDVMAMPDNDPFFAAYAEAVRRMHDLPESDPRSWRSQALIHLKSCKHLEPDFLHWHRHYLANFEAICASLLGDPGFTLPYWNWSAKNGCYPNAFYDLDKLNVAHWKDRSNASSPDWGNVSTVGTRRLGRGQGLQDNPVEAGPFRASAIADLQTETDFEIYSRSLESGPHGSGHVIAGGARGHMGNGMSPLDPILWLHHCNVDRLWAQWQSAGNETPSLASSYSGDFVDAAGKPVTTARSDNALDLSSFNYTYDTLSGGAPKQLSLQPLKDQGPLKLPPPGQKQRLLGIDKTSQKVAARLETRFNVSVDGLLPELFGSRTFWATDFTAVQRLAIGPNRLLARLSHVTLPPGREQMVVNVFANCPYLSPQTGADDIHYAGSFSFFGDHAPQAGHAGHGGNNFYVNLTPALRSLAGDGRIASDTIRVQLMALTIDPESKAGFSVGAVEIIAT